MFAALALVAATLPTLDTLDGRSAFVLVPDPADPSWYRWHRPVAHPPKPAAPRLFADADDVFALSAVPNADGRLLTLKTSTGREPWRLPWSAVRRLDLLPLALGKSAAPADADSWAGVEGDWTWGLVRRVAPPGVLGSAALGAADGPEQSSAVASVVPSARLFRPRSVLTPHHRLRLADGSRLRVAGLNIEGGTCSGATPRGLAVSVPLREVAAIEVERHPSASRLEALGGRTAYTPFGDEPEPPAAFPDAGVTLGSAWYDRGIQLHRGQRREFDPSEKPLRVTFRTIAAHRSTGRLRVTVNGRVAASVVLGETCRVEVPANSAWAVEYPQAGPGELPGGVVDLVEGWAIRR